MTGEVILMHCDWWLQNIFIWPLEEKKNQNQKIPSQPRLKSSQKKSCYWQGGPDFAAHITWILVGSPVFSITSHYKSRRKLKKLISIRGTYRLRWSQTMKDVYRWPNNKIPINIRIFCKCSEIFSIRHLKIFFFSFFFFNISNTLKNFWLSQLDLITIWRGFQEYFIF